MSRDRPFRVLHLIDQPAGARGAERPTEPDAELLACAALIERLPGFDQSVCLIGGNGLEERAAAVGLASTNRVTPPLGRAALARRGVREFVRDRGVPDIVHCWSAASMSLGMALGAAPVCASPLSDPPPPASALRGAGAALVVCADKTGWSRATGSAPESITTAPLPRIELATTPLAGRTFRAALGVENGQPLIMLIGGGPGEADAVRLVFLLGLLETADFPATWVIPASTSRIPRAQRCFALTPHRARLIVSDLPFTDLASSADLGVWLGGAWADSQGGLPSPAGAVLIGAAMAAGVPVVTPGGPLVGSLLQPVGACRAFNATVAEVARVLLPLVGEAGRTAGLRAALLGRRAPLADDGFERIVAELWLSRAAARAAYAPQR